MADAYHEEDWEGTRDQQGQGRSWDVEKVLVGALLTDRDAIADVAEVVTPEDFDHAPERAAYAAILRLWDRREPADIVSVDAECREAGVDIVDFLFLSACLTALMESGTAVHARFYAERVRRAAMRRRFVSLFSREMGKMASDPNMDPTDAMANVASALGDLELSRGDGPTPMDTIVEEVVGQIDGELSGEIERRFTPTKFGELDDALGGGFAPGDVCVLAARPSMGKSALAAALMEAAAEVGNVLNFSIEMDRQMLTRRALARGAGVPLKRIRNGQLTDAELDRLAATARELSDRPVWIDDTVGVTTDRILARIQRLKKDGPISLVVIDYLELVGDDLDNGKVPESARISKIIRRLKEIARICAVPMVVLCQVSRDVDARPNKMPTMAHLAWSRMIEQVADQVIFLYRHDYYVNKGLEDYDPVRAGICELSMQKNRNGEEGLFQLEYDARTFTFTGVQKRQPQARPPADEHGYTTVWE